MTENPFLLIEDHGAVRRLILNRPEAFNALSDGMLAALDGALSDLPPSVRVVVLAAKGKAFCAGHDLKEMQACRADADGGRAAFAALFDRCAAVMQKIVALPQPVIAEVQGVATAAGCQLAASCDLIVAAENARFGVNGINLGLFCSTPAVALSRRLPPAAAFELLSTGEFMAAPRAHALGLVNRLAPPEGLTEAALQLAATLAAKHPGALQLGKAAFRDQAGLDLAAAYQVAGGYMTENLSWPDTEEGIAAFLERRPASWAER